MTERSKGCLIFAYNSSDVDYVKLATINAKLIKKHLNLPTSIITDQLIDSNVFDHQIIVSNNSINTRSFKTETGNTKTINWKNIGRDQAFNLTPYDITLLIDADYIVNSDSLLGLVDIDAPIVSFKSAHDVMGANRLAADRLVSFNSIEMYWATVVRFDKSELAKSVFDTMTHIKDNWDYARTVYNFPAGPYRNDFSFSVGMHAVSGLSESRSTIIPWSLPTLSSDCYITSCIPGTIVATDGTTAVKVIGDLHIMNKWLNIDLLEGLL